MNAGEVPGPRAGVPAHASTTSESATSFMGSVRVTGGRVTAARDGIARPRHPAILRGGS
jgi:hypothetical protein